MANDIKKMLEDAKKEQLEEQQKLHESILKKMGGITFENLDENLKNIIMSKTTTTGNAPVPKNPMGNSSAKTDSKIKINGIFQQICDDLLVKNNVYLWGKAGTGKTVLAKMVAQYLLGDEDDINRTFQKDKKFVDGSRIGERVPPYFILNCSQWTSPMNIIGGYSIRGYTEGQLELAWKYGAVLIIDELPKLDPNTAGLLNDALSMAADEDAFLTSGRGESIPKHKDFMVIGAGNTDMKGTSINFGGNNRQDYSLVDRFVGSIYEIKEDKCLERDLTYTAVYSIAQGLREFLLTDPNRLEAITLRSMLNFNRTYQNEMLRKTRSVLAFPAVGTVLDSKRGYQSGKTLRDAVMSFVDGLGNDASVNCKAQAKFDSFLNESVKVNLEDILFEAENAEELFKKDFRRVTGKDCDTGLSIYADNNETK